MANKGRITIYQIKINWKPCVVLHFRKGARFLYRRILNQDGIESHATFGSIIIDD